MSEEQKELFFDLLTKKAVYGLDEAEQLELDRLDTGNAEAEFRSLELTTAAINLAAIEIDEPMPAHLFAKIAANAAQFVGSPAIEAEPQAAVEEPWPPAEAPIYTSDEIFEKKGPASWFGWLGWAAAGLACIALVINIALTRTQPTEIANVPTVETPQIKSYAQMREEMLASTARMVRATWAAGNIKDLKEVSCDVVWSDEKQAGYMGFRGLAKNDTSKETYQLWIFDKTQDKATPIDGGTFDIPADGEVVIPINAKLKASGAEMFAITVEKPGGVVVSKREKIAALAKVETKSSQPT